MAPFSAFTKLFVFQPLLHLLLHTLGTNGVNLKETQYLRHFYGNCLEYDVKRQVFIYATICREKFQWSGGAKIVHIPTTKCLTVNSTADGSFLTLTSQCNGRNSLFQYDESKHVIIHVISGKCLYPETNKIPPSNDAVILQSGCSSGHANKYWFRPTAYYIIRHSSGLCWQYNAGDNQIKLRDSYCDRFYYENDYRLKDVYTGKCVWQSATNLLILTSDCASVTNEYKLTESSNMELSTGRCLHPLVHHTYPRDQPMGTNHGCSNADRFQLYDERDILEVTLTSESCDDISDPDCSKAKGHITVNGNQHSLDQRGINIVLFDYRSGLFEHRSSYDVLESSTERTNLRNFLNGLKEGKILLMVAKDAVTFDESAAQALQRVGVSATFATTNLPTSRCSMANAAYTGQGRKSWEKSINKVGGEGVSVIVITIMPFRELSGKDDCSQELGAQDGTIPNSAFTAASIWSSSCSPYHGRLQDRSNGWCSQNGSPISDHIEVDLGTVKIVAGVAIQGDGNTDTSQYYVTKFKLQYSTDNLNWYFYVENGNSAKEFDGVRREGRLETSISWFQRRMARHLRIIPTARSTGQANCIRLEVYGCFPATTIFAVHALEQAQPFHTYKYLKVPVSVYSLVKEPSKMTFGMANAVDNQSLAVNIQQMHITGIEISPILNYDNIANDKVTHNKIRNQSTHFISSQFCEINVKQPNYFFLNMTIKFRVLDAKQPSGNGWGVLSMEKNDQISILSYPQNFKRHPKDKSILNLKITEIDQRELINGEKFQIDVSLKHVIYKSFANAYNINIFIYYDSNFLDLMSLQFKDSEDGFNVLPSRNITSQGMIHINTDELRLLNNHFASVEFKMAVPKAVVKGEKCNGVLLVDFTYKDNLNRFNGKVHSTINKFIPYQCKIENEKDISLKSVRLNVPQLSMLYDDVNKEFFFCFRRTKYATRNAPNCYRQMNDGNIWHEIQHIASLKGIDVVRRELFGVGRLGTAYSWSFHPFDQGFQIEDSYWENAESNSNVRKSVVINNVSLLSLNPSEGEIISTSGRQLWAATKSGLWKKPDNEWKRVIVF